MKITVAKYTNAPINFNNGSIGETTDCYLQRPEQTQLGGVDHFMKKDIKSIVEAYKRRIKKDNMPAGDYVINITAGRNDISIGVNVES